VRKFNIIFGTVAPTP